FAAPWHQSSQVLSLSLGKWRQRASKPLPPWNGQVVKIAPIAYVWRQIQHPAHDSQNAAFHRVENAQTNRDHKNPTRAQACYPKAFYPPSLVPLKARKNEHCRASRVTQ